MRVKFMGCSDAQANWGNCNDPRKDLFVGEQYEAEPEIHSWHTKYWIHGTAYNSACFEEVENES